MRRIIGTIVGAILAISLAITTVGRIVATLKTFLIVGLIAMAVIIIVWLGARRPRRGQRGAAAAATRCRSGHSATRSASTSSRTKQAARWSLTTPTACIIA